VPGGRTFSKYIIYAASSKNSDHCSKAVQKKSELLSHVATFANWDYPLNKLAFKNGMIEGSRKDIFKSNHRSQRLRTPVLSSYAALPHAYSRLKGL
jgi:hypothetical protein